MYRGSRLAASFLLVLTGVPVAAIAVAILPRAIEPGGAWIVVPLAVAFAAAHFGALVGVARGRAWGRTLALTVAESGGGLAIAAAVALLLGADPFAASSPLPGDAIRADAAGLIAWMVAMYGLLGISVGRIRLAGWSRSSHWWPAPLLRAAV